MHVVLSQGESLVVEFDGHGDKFEIHLNTQTEPNAVTVLRKRGATLSAKGYIPDVLYRRVSAEPKSSDKPELDAGGNDESGMVGATRPRLKGFFMDASGVVHCTQLVYCAVVKSKLGDYLIVETLSTENEVTGQFDYYETMEELEDVLGRRYAQLTI